MLRVQISVLLTCAFRHRSCNASITTCEVSIVKTSSIKSYDTDDLQHPPKMDLKVYEWIRSIKRRIEEATAPVSLFYDEQVKVKMDLLVHYQDLLVLNLLYRNIVGGSNDQFQKHSHQLLELIVLFEL